MKFSVTSFFVDKEVLEGPGAALGAHLRRTHFVGIGNKQGMSALPNK